MSSLEKVGESQSTVFIYLSSRTRVARLCPLSTTRRCSVSTHFIHPLGARSDQTTCACMRCRNGLISYIVHGLDSIIPEEIIYSSHVDILRVYSIACDKRKKSRRREPTVD